MRCKAVLALVCCLGLAARQAAIKPFQASPAASVTQELGISSLRIDYHRPAVKGRKLWGALVPYGQVWRAGANEATTFTFSDPVRIDGKPLAAGTYGFFAIPGPDQWTLILNKVGRQWGAFNYQPGQDALRWAARPGSGPAREDLSYDIQLAGPDSLRVTLAWGTLAVGFDVDFAARDRYWVYLEQAVAGAGPEAWQPLNQAAAYCLQSDSHLDRALAWVEQSIRIQPGYRNLSLKAQLLRRSGQPGPALALLDQAIALAAPGPAQEELRSLRAEWAKQGGEGQAP
jgi:hypothetical protein